jgi:hypothetical protein
MKKTVKKTVAKTSVKKTVAKKPMMKMGGAKKKMQDGGYPTYQGPVSKQTTDKINNLNSKNVGPRVYNQQETRDTEDMKQMMENYDRIPKGKKGGIVKKTTAKKTVVKSKKK